MSDGLEQQIKEMIVQRCFLTVRPDEIESEAPLMDSLGLDSVHRFAVPISSDTALQPR